MRFKNEKGQTVVFLSIILPVIILLLGILVDGSRIIAGKTQVERSVESAVRSALACYNSKLKMNYGIFAIGEKTGKTLEDTIKDYISKNLMIDEIENKGSDKNSKTIRLYDYNIEDIEVTPLFNLTEKKVVREQILEYMKYRAPKRIIEGVWEKLTAVKDATKMSEAYDKKMKVDRLMHEAGKYQEELKKDIDGLPRGDVNKGLFINGFIIDNIRNELTDKFIQLVSECKSLLDESKEDNKDDKDDKDGTDAVIQTKDLKKDITDVVHKLQDRQAGYINIIEDALDNLQKISEIRINKIDPALEELESYMIKNFGNLWSISGKDGTVTEMLQNFCMSVKKDMEAIVLNLPDTKETGKIAETLDKNISCLNIMISETDKIYNKIVKNDIKGLNFDNIATELHNAISGYDNIIYNYFTAETGKNDKSMDKRKEAVQDAEESLKNDDKTDKDIIDSGLNMEELPSVKEVQSKSPDIIDGGIEFDHRKKNGGFTEKAFDYIGSMSGILIKGVKGLRDEIYINEYIMGMFKNAVPELKSGSGVIEDIDLSRIEKSKRETFFNNGEIEYILHGNSSESMNKLFVKGQILLVRFVMNTLHVYLDNQKKLLAEETAAAISGWWTAGSGIPLVSNLIMCGWGMMEAVYDLNEIMSGKSIPFYKLKGDWKTDFGAIKESGPKTDQRFTFSYYDYLRLFLLLEGWETKTGRIEDLIQLDMQKYDKGFKMADYNTYIRVKAVISMNYLFMTNILMPSDMKVSRRHKFEVLIYQGY